MTCWTLSPIDRAFAKGFARSIPIDSLGRGLGRERGERIADFALGVEVTQPFLDTRRAVRFIEHQCMIDGT